jgi:hypothetical protein
MSLGTILIIILIIFLLGGFSGRFGGYGYWLWPQRLRTGGARERKRRELSENADFAHDELAETQLKRGVHLHS